MREEDSNCFSKWEDELPSPEDLIPLSQSLITPDIALAFNITTSHHAPQLPQPPRLPPTADLESPDGGPSGGSGSDEQTRTVKRPRLVWTPQLHKRFVDAVAHLGIKNAVPKTIMQLMSVDGLTRENVASHLQKYRLYLKRMQGIPNGGSGVGNLAAAVGMDPATDRLFASSPVPAHFLHPGLGNSEHYLPFVPVPPHQHHSQIRASSPAQLQFHQFGNSPPNVHSFLRQSQAQIHRLSTPVHDGNVEDVESATPRKALTLFPTGDDLSL